MGVNEATKELRGKLATISNNPAAKIALAVLPSLAIKGWNAYKRRTTLEIKFNSEQVVFDAVSRYVTEHVLDETQTREFTYSAEQRWDDKIGDERTDHYGIQAGYGKHMGTFEGVKVMVDRAIDEDFKETLNLTFHTGDKKIVKDFGEAIRRYCNKQTEKPAFVSVYTNSDDWWCKTGKLPIRKIASVITRDKIGEQMIAAIKAFETQRDYHHRLGLPHHMGIMLHGLPGCGKSSLIHSVASETGRSIHYLNLGSVTKDQQLTSLLSSDRDWNNALLVIEDIDAAGVKVNRTEANANQASPVSLSVLLNALDGILCPDGLVVIAATNHIDDLDPALRREGRFDYTYELKPLGYDEFIRLCAMFGKEVTDYPVGPGMEKTGAECRAMLMGKKS